jgi:hypothetical protein
MRNVLINGAMAIDQRNNGASQTFTAGAGVAYCVDRFYASCTGANVSGQRVSGPTGFQYAYKFTGAASVTGILFGQRVESVNCAQFASQNVTLSANIANSLLTSVTWTAYYANSTDTFSSKTQIATGTWTVSSTATVYSANFNAGANAGNGIAIELSVGAQTSGTWTVTAVQLEPGSVATPFEWCSYGLELSLCQRYYYRLKAGTSYVNGGVGRAYSTTNAQAFVAVPVSMRAAPTSSYSALSDWNDSGGGTPSAIVPNSQYSLDYRQMTVNLTGTYTTGQAIALNANNTTNAWLDWSAEL